VGNFQVIENPMSYQWNTRPVDAAGAVNSRDPHAALLLAWAGWAADSLLYLKELDTAFFGPSAKASVHDSRVVDAAHFRWCASSAVTALDLAAAALGRLNGVAPVKDRELDLRTAVKEQKLDPVSLKWVESVWKDAEYQLIRNARHPMVHGKLNRITVGDDRSEFVVKDASGKSTLISTPDLIDMAVRVTTTHLEALFADVLAGRI
jgi:hypothetical protein